MNDSPAHATSNGKTYWANDPIKYYPPDEVTQCYIGHIVKIEDAANAYISYTNGNTFIFKSVPLKDLEKIGTAPNIAPTNPGAVSENLSKSIFGTDKDTEPILTEQERAKKSEDLFELLSVGDHIATRSYSSRMVPQWRGFGKTVRVTNIYKSNSRGLSGVIVGLNESIYVPCDMIHCILESNSEPKEDKIYEPGVLVFVNKDFCPEGLTSYIAKVACYVAETDMYEVSFINPGVTPEQIKELSLNNYLVPRAEAKTRNDGGVDPNYSPSKSTSSQNTSSSNKSYQTYTAYFKVYGDDEIHTAALFKDEIEKAVEKISFEEMTIDGVQVPVFIIKPEHAAWKKAAGKNPLMCAYNATESFLIANLGIKLSTEDSSWYKQHPLMESNGLPQPHTITVLNDLVSVYGLGIKKVYCRKDTSAFPETHEWQKVLGINPAAFATRNVSNEEFLEGLPEEARSCFNVNDWAFEYVDHLPQKPLVVMNGSSGSTSWATGLGHASYSSPRAFKGNGWHIALEYDKLENCNRFSEAPTTDQLIEETWVLDISNCKDDSGTLIKTSVERGYSSYKGSTAYSGQSSGYKSSEGGASTPNPLAKTKNGSTPTGTKKLSSTETPLRALGNCKHVYKHIKTVTHLNLSKNSGHPLMAHFKKFLGFLGLTVNSPELIKTDFKYSKHKLIDVKKRFIADFCSDEMFEYPFPQLFTTPSLETTFLEDHLACAQTNIINVDTIEMDFDYMLGEFCHYLVVEVGYMTTFAFICEMLNTPETNITMENLHMKVGINDIWRHLTKFVDNG